MSDYPPASDSSPGQTYRLMAFAALTSILLLSVLIYSLSRLQSKPWTSSLIQPSIKIMESPLDLPELPPDSPLQSTDLHGKWTLLTFWSSSCEPCLTELPLLNNLALNWDGGPLRVLSINIDPENSENRELAKRFLTDGGIILPTVFDRNFELKNAFEVNEYPKHYLLDSSSMIRWISIGAYDWSNESTREDLAKLIQPQYQDPDPRSDRDPEE